MSMRTFNEFAVRKALREACDRAGSQQAFADQTGMSQCHVAHVASGYRSPTERILRALGYSRITRYVRTKGRAGK